MTTHCHHCNDLVPTSRMKADAVEQFCCHGCELAAAIIADNGAADYYQLRAQQSSDLRQQQLLKPEQDIDTQAYDSDAFQEHYVHVISDDCHQVTWYVQGAHCAACVWLLERLQLFDPGIRSSRLQIASQQLITRYNPQQTSPAAIARQLAAIGYQVYPWHGPLRRQQQVADQRRLFLRFAIACASMLGCMHVSWNILAGEFTLDLDAASQAFFALLAALLSLPAITWCAWPWYRSAWHALRRRHLNIDVSISAIILLGAAVSFYHLALGRSDLYFDAVTMFVCFLLGGNMLLYLARQQIDQEQDTLKQVLPLFVSVQRGVQSMQCRIDDIAIGDTLLMKAGQRLPVDGRLLSDCACCDLALLNGEYMPRQHQAGDEIPAGALLIDSDAELSATSTCARSRLAQLLESTQQDLDNDSLTERLLQYFTPVISMLALLTWWLWSSLDPTRAWDQAIAVFIVACPCALGIAAPLAHAVLLRRAAALGIFISQPQRLRQLLQARNVVFDKTGTLTHGRLQLEQIEWLEDCEAELVPDLLAICKQSQHPIARSISDYFKDISPSRLLQPVTLVKQGLSAHCSCGEVLIGKAQQDRQRGSNQTDISVDGRCVARLSFRDQLRDELLPFIQNLPATCSISSGDHHSSVATLAERIGISAYGNQSPEQKRDFVHSLAKPVVMIGDGVNDALALQAADVAIGVRGGLEAAMQHSDVYISDAVEERLPQLWRLVRSHQHCLISCLSVSLVYNALGIGLAMAGLWGPFICAVAMPLSSISVMALAWYWPFQRALRIPALSHNTDLAQQVQTS